MGNRIAEIYKDCEFAAVWRYDFSNDNWYVSLRGRKPDIDLTPYAKKYGGGGHENAGSCQIDNDEADEVLRELIAQINADG